MEAKSGCGETSFPSIAKDTLPIGLLCCMYVASLTFFQLDIKELILAKVGGNGVTGLREEIIKHMGENV